MTLIATQKQNEQFIDIALQMNLKFSRDAQGGSATGAER
jgi:hypothetical protein